VRRADDSERFTTLDGQERILKSSDLTIRDSARVVALAGIMGGENSEISDETTNILLESAYFNPSAIRLTSKKLGLHTESSHRFERGADINVLTRALDRAASLIAELAGGSIAQGVLDVHDTIPENKKIAVNLNSINHLLGTNLTGDEVMQIFHSLEFSVQLLEPGIFEVEAPSFRVDIEREIDLIEEVARFYGYDKIAATMPIARVFSDLPTKHQRLEKKVKDLFVAHGFNEIINFSFISPESFDKINLEPDDIRRESIKLLNPLVEEQSVMRTVLLPGLLETAARNTSFRLLNLRIFEMRRVYLPKSGRELPDEPLHVGGLLSGMRTCEGWNQEKTTVDFYDAKGVVENLLEQLNIYGATFSGTAPEAFYHPGKACTIICNGEAIGSLGEIHPTVQENYGLEKPCQYFELDFEKLVPLSKDEVTAKAPPRFPDTFRDIAMLVVDETPVVEILSCVKSLKENEVEGVDVFDLYKGEHVPPGQKSVAVRVRYRSLERTLTDDEVNRVHSRIINHLVTKLNVSIR
jgi:phenylalanyl-tRNA synthetase beta chain